MKNQRKYTIATILCLGIFILSGCTKKFEEFNTNTSAITDEQASTDGTLQVLLLQQAQKAIIYNNVGDYQVAENLSSSAFGGYFTPPTPFRSNSNNINYDLVPGWNNASWRLIYPNLMNPLTKIESTTKGNASLSGIYAMNKVLRVEGMHRISDLFGPIIYTQYNKANTEGGVDYDTQEQAYNAFFADLEEAKNALVPLVTANTPKSPIMVRADLAYGGSYAKWLKFANTLRLRLALRISKVNPTLAKQQGEKALDPANGGIISTNDESFIVQLGAPHILNTINASWNDTRMAAPIETYLGGFNDPRLGKYFLPAIDPTVAGQFKGIREGVDIISADTYKNYSALATVPPAAQLLTAAEAWFLKSEAALKGWANAGTAKDNYETGILRSFDQYGLAANATAYINDALSIPKQYIDPKALTPGINDVKTGSPYLSTITIKWDEAASESKKLERIITQKWIAIFPDGAEAWSEYRRTGFPILFPIVINKSGGVIPTVIPGTINTGVRRLPFANVEFDNNSAAVKRAVAMLGGPDNGATRLWWDKP
ncbi:Susd and RagB outer membrane lipoprotein [Pedobacter steynii]|uniref:Susd and RagB outer membrane lipoprotein n=1 Tax=Pedobacter steynii TaxID=430522 RepID=A0A1G9NKM9_9SPHI|nr:SusD/RagB family nutrient-binding outer membrane lipoprotein [Pedobacter steynii]NQX39272.1 SusD/RagB family nutrient-binding outer membrane lipoprotein [Pedobacter steynii]SDL86914.1 Susd and RagB outer membrane lipoprotein [Pedobacter steynii]